MAFFSFPYPGAQSQTKKALEETPGKTLSPLSKVRLTPPPQRIFHNFCKHFWWSLSVGQTPASGG